MPFNLVDPNAGKAGGGPGRGPLTNTVRIRNASKDGSKIHIVISGDIAERLGCEPGSKVNLLIGDGTDFGSFVLVRTTKTDKRGYTVHHAGPNSRTLSMAISASKFFPITMPRKGPLDCVVRADSHEIMATIPVSALARPAAAHRQPAASNGLSAGAVPA